MEKMILKYSCWNGFLFSSGFDSFDSRHDTNNTKRPSQCLLPVGRVFCGKGSLFGSLGWRLHYKIKLGIQEDIQAFRISMVRFGGIDSVPRRRKRSTGGNILRIPKLKVQNILIVLVVLLFLRNFMISHDGHHGREEGLQELKEVCVWLIVPNKGRKEGLIRNNLCMRSHLVCSCFDHPIAVLSQVFEKLTIPFHSHISFYTISPYRAGFHPRRSKTFSQSLWRNWKRRNWVNSYTRQKKWEPRR